MEDPTRELTMYSYINNHLCFEYFVGYEVITLMGYKNIAQTLKAVSRANQLKFSDYPGVKDPPLDPRTVLITRDGACEILHKTRKPLTPDLHHFFEQFGITTTNTRSLSKEQKNLSFVTNIFKTEITIPQYPIDNGRYKLDLYFPDYKIIVECDENGHGDRCPASEREREEYVNTELGISMDNWVRFDPDEKDFNISTTIGQIYMKINLMKDFSNTMKRCCTCRKERPTTQFQKNKGNPDGLEKRCRECKHTVAAEMQKVIDQEDTVTPDEKHCPQCETTKPSTEFWKQKARRKDGLASICKECSKLDKKEKHAAAKVEPAEFKKCVKCEKTKKSMVDFGALKARFDGRSNVCKECNRAYGKQKAAEKQGKPKACKQCKEEKPLTDYPRVTCGHGKVCNACQGVKANEKLCKTCNTVKGVFAFYALSTSADGLNSKCKDCCKAYEKAWKNKN